jgi:hypothetical protein
VNATESGIRIALAIESAVGTLTTGEGKTIGPALHDSDMVSGAGRTGGIKTGETGAVPVPGQVAGTTDGTTDEMIGEMTGVKSAEMIGEIAAGLAREPSEVTDETGAMRRKNVVTAVVRELVRCAVAVAVAPRVLGQSVATAPGRRCGLTAERGAEAASATVGIDVTAAARDPGTTGGSAAVNGIGIGIGIETETETETKTVKAGLGRLRPLCGRLRTWTVTRRRRGSRPRSRSGSRRPRPI